MPPKKKPVTIHDIYAVVTGTAKPRDDYPTDKATTYGGISRRLGRDEMDPEVHALIKAMAVSGYIKQSPLGGFHKGPTEMPEEELTREQELGRQRWNKYVHKQEDQARPGALSRGPKEEMQTYTDADRRHLIRQAKVRGIKVERGESAESIDAKLAARFREDHQAILDAPTLRCRPAPSGVPFPQQDEYQAAVDRNTGTDDKVCEAMSDSITDLGPHGGPVSLVRSAESGEVMHMCQRHIRVTGYRPAQDGAACDHCAEPRELFTEEDARDMILDIGMTAAARSMGNGGYNSFSAAPAYDGYDDPVTADDVAEPDDSVAPERMWPAPDGRGWVDWTDEPRIHPHATGYHVTDEQGRRVCSITPAIDGTPDWIVRRKGKVTRHPSAHEALLASVDGQPDPAALRRPAPSGVPVPDADEPPAPQRPERFYEDHWLTGNGNEDTLTKMGKCPYQTGYGGWGDPLAYCGNERSPEEDDGPYCGPHADEIRHDRGRGGPV